MPVVDTTVPPETNSVISDNTGYNPNFDRNTQPTISTPISEEVTEPVVTEPETEKIKAESKEEPDLKASEVVEKIIPNKDPVERTLTYEEVERTYTQRPLSYFRKIEFIGLLGKTLDEIIETGVDLDSIFGDVAPTSMGDFNPNNLGELTQFVSAIAKLASYAPDFIKEAYVIALNVPRNEKLFAYEALELIDDELGEDILVTFIDQNYKELESFFTERLRGVGDRIQSLRDQS